MITELPPGSEMWSRCKSKLNISVELDSISKDNDPRTNATNIGGLHCAVLCS